MSSRFEMIMNLDTFKLAVDKRQSAVACIIGPGGSNIKRYSKLIPGIYIRLYNDKKGKDVSVHGSECDRIYIAGRSEKDVVKCQQIVQTDIMSFITPSKVKTTRPSFQLHCPPKLVGVIIGKNGRNIKWIQSKVGGGCFIAHNRETGCFDISAMTQPHVDRATKLIQHNMTTFDNVKRSVEVATKPKNVYDSISYDSSDDDTSEMELSDTTTTDGGMDLSSNELFPSLPSNTPSKTNDLFTYSKKYWTNVDVVKSSTANIQLNIERNTPTKKVSHEETNEKFTLPTFDPNARWGDMLDDSEDEDFFQ
jgi:transcription antitermination factor NusA-like protein